LGPIGQRRLFWLLMVSWLLHGAILLVLLLRMNLERPEAPPELPSPVAMVFEPSPDGARSAPDPTPVQTPSAPSVPDTAPAETAMPLPPAFAPPEMAMPTPPMPMPEPVPLPEPMPERQAVESPLPVPPMQAAPPPLLAEVEPDEPDVPEPAEEALPLPAPAPPQFAAPPRPPPAPPRPRPAPAPAPSPFSLSAPSQYSFGTPPPSARQATRSPPLAMGPAAPSATQSFGQFAEVTKGHVDPSWMSRLHDWWLRNGYYPEAAARMGQDGRVKLEIVVDRSGRVKNLELLRRSGSQWLDLGAQGVFRNAQLPPFPPNSSDDEITLTLTINYVLIRQ